MAIPRISFETIKKVSFTIFGANFSCKVKDSTKPEDISPETIVNYLKKLITEVRYETDRADGKKALLFYQNSSIPGNLSFVFALEETPELAVLMKAKELDIPAIITYCYENNSHLNHKI